MFEKVMLLDQGHVDEGGRAQGVTRQRSRARARRSEATFDYVLVVVGRRPNAQHPGLDKTSVQGRTTRASSRSTGSGAPPSRRSSPSATWPASRCWRTRRRTRRAWRWRRSPGRRRCSSRRRFRRSSSPIRRSPGRPHRGQAEKQGIDGRGREVPVGRVGPRDRASIAWTA